MYAVTDDPAADLDRTDPAPARGPAGLDEAPSLLRRTAYLATAVLLAAAAVGCGDSDQKWGPTESSDRRSASPAEGRSSPPPTPDYRKLASATDDQEEPAGGASGRGSSGDGDELPERVTYPQAESLYHAGDFDRALLHFRAYTQQRPDNAWGHYMVGLSAWKAGERKRAVSAFEQTLDRDPDHLKTLVNLSRVLLELERPEEAREPIRKASELAPESAEVLRVAGNVADELGERDTAVRRYRQALAADGTDAWSANNLGLLLIRQGRYEEALGPLARAAQLRPELGVVQNNLGVALERTGHLDQARQRYREAAEAGHEKAEASLARLEDVRGGEGAEPVEIEALARSFAEEVEGWRVDAVARSPTADTLPGQRSGPSGATPNSADPEGQTSGDGSGGPDAGAGPAPQAEPSSDRGPKQPDGPAGSREADSTESEKPR